jgi:hypothetical protein
VRDLSLTISQPGEDNDAIDLLKAQPQLDHIANGPVDAHGESRRGAFPETVEALQDATPELQFARPYAVDLTGWFDDFSASGAYDALGAFSRAGLALSGLTLDPTLGVLLPVPPALRAAIFEANAVTGRNNRCPGSVERDHGDGSNPFKPQGLDCDRDQVPIGP